MDLADGTVANLSRDFLGGVQAPRYCCCTRGGEKIKKG